MPISIADNFQYKGTKPLDKRIQYATISDMVDTPLADLYDGCLAYVTANKKNYQYDSNNTVDQTLGKWREFSSGGGGSSYTAGDGIDITENVISTKKTEDGDMDEIVSDLPTGGIMTVTGFTPIGTIISIFSETAPKNFLICDGSTYNKADYPELAYHLLHLTTHSQYEVDGDDTKFKVPDLKGEFLRGTGTNGHTNQGSGANVGVHQDGTEHINIGLDMSQGGNAKLFQGTTNGNTSIESANRDKTINGSNTTGWTQSSGSYTTWAGNGIKSFTSRPTNTSVLYCIAVRDIYTNPMNDYSTSEKVVGSWIDGKPIYQKTIELVKPTDLNTPKNTPINVIVDTMVDMRIVYHQNNGASRVLDSYSSTIANASSTSNSGAGIQTWFQGDTSNASANVIVVMTGVSGYIENCQKIYATIQYTKTTD